MSEDREVPKDLSNKKWFHQDFSGMDLKGVPMHHSRFTICNFTGVDISGNDCTHSDFSGSNLTDVRCNGTDFGHSVLGCRFFPKDAYGMTVTLECRTFKGMVVSKLWYLSWLYLATLTIPENDKGVNLRDLVIGALGFERFAKLKKIFDVRQM
jgi:uncharacterized protein YjbI with pentapeptide repeats